jgi:ketosteroid isomerase-like protein
MSADENMATVRRGYEAFTKGDMDTLLALYDDDATHIVPGSSKVSGSHKGKENILALYGKLFELSGGTLSIDLRHVMTDGDSRVIAVHKTRLEKDGESIEETEALLFTFHDGKVAEIQDFFADIALNDRLFS